MGLMERLNKFTDSVMELFGRPFRKGVERQNALLTRETKTLRVALEKKAFEIALLKSTHKRLLPHIGAQQVTRAQRVGSPAWHGWKNARRLSGGRD